MPICREIPYRDPLDACASWADEPYLAFLDSAAAGDPRSRWSWLGIEPFQVLDVVDGRARLDETVVAADPFTVLAEQLGRFRLETPASVPFPGGAMGFLGYELGRHIEKLPQRHPADPTIPEMAIGFYDLILAFDTAARRAWLVSTGLPETDPAARRRRAERRAEACLARLAAGPPPGDPAVLPQILWQSDLAPADYARRVTAILDHIRAGDIFQANFTMRFAAPRPAELDPFAVYRALRAASPSPFAAYLRCGSGLALASASPERFLSLDRSGAIEARPIKGTRPRGLTPAEDRVAAEELAASEKDRAENLMIVDLIRNDLGRVAVTGSVAVPVLAGLESFASVHHLVSVVTARLRDGLGPVDLLRASFPGGSVTGAPKIRAMEIIDAQEASRRGAYCGTVLKIGFDGSMDSSIVIRTLSIMPTAVIAQAGGGIVADSDPAAEYAEMRVKVAPLLQVLGGRVAGEGGP